MKLVDFTGQYKNNKVSLTWHTAGDAERSVFYLEKSYDQVNWHTIDSIVGKQVSGHIVEYKSDDATPATGTNWYRLRHRMESGAFENSDIIKVNVDEKYLPISLYPNPAADYIIINNTSGKIRLYNSMMQIQQLRLLQISSSQYKIDCARLSPGIYFIRVHETTLSFVKK